MDLVKRVFSNIKINKDLLVNYGFNIVNEKLVYEKDILDDFKLIIEFTNEFNIKVIDKNLDEEYLGYKYKSKGGYGSLVESEIETILLDIRDFVCLGHKYLYSQTNRIDEYMSLVYGKCENPFVKYPHIGAYKESGNNKWYALINRVSYKTLDKLLNEEEVEIINLKVNKKELNDLLKKDGVYPAYHMNKDNWVSIVLDDTVKDEELIMLINDSYDLVQENISNKKFYKRKTY